MSRLQPICSKDGLTNFYSPCQAGCQSKTKFSPRINPYANPGENPKELTIYQNCSCIIEAWENNNKASKEHFLLKKELIFKLLLQILNTYIMCKVSPIGLTLLLLSRSASFSLLSFFINDSSSSRVTLKNGFGKIFCQSGLFLLKK